MPKRTVPIKPRLVAYLQARASRLALETSMSAGAELAAVRSFVEWLGADEPRDHLGTWEDV